MVISKGHVQDAIVGMPAYESGLGPYMQILGVNGRSFSVGILKQAIKDSKSSSGPILILASNTGSLETYKVNYHGGIRFPHLQLIAGAQDYLTEILKPLAVHDVAAQSQSRSRALLDGLFRGHRRFLIQDGYPAALPHDPGRAFDNSTQGKTLFTEAAGPRCFINEDDSARRGHETAQVANFVVGNRAFRHRGDIIGLGNNAALKDHHCVGRNQTAETGDVPLLSCLPDPIFELNDSLDHRFCRMQIGVFHTGTLHASSIAHAAGSGSDSQFRITPNPACMAATA